MEIKEKTGEVKLLKPKKTSTGKDMYFFHLGEKTGKTDEHGRDECVMYSGFGTPKFMLGDTIKFTYTDENGYLNVKSIEVLNKNEGQLEQYVDKNNRSNKIENLALLKIASRLVGDVAHDDKVNLCVETAKKLKENINDW